MEPQAYPVVTDTPPERPIPRVRGGLPVLGQALAFQRDPLNLLEQAWRAHGEVFQFLLGGRKVVLFAGPEAHDAYFRAPDDQLSAREVYQFTVPIFGKGVAYDVAPERMAEQLRFLAPLMRDGPMHAYTRLIDNEVKDYTARWGDEGEIDLPVVTNELTVNIASRCLLGEEIRTRLDTGFARLYHDLQRGINTLGFFFPRLPTLGHIQRDRARRQVASLMRGILAERRRTTGARPGDFMQALIDARYTDGSALGDEEITGLLLTVLFAGQHTSGVLAAWVGIDLLRHRQHLAAVVAEIRAVYGEGQTLSLDTLKSQMALEHAVREGERLHPPLIVLVRRTLGDLEYHGFRIRAGTLAMVSPLLSHRLPTVFKDPERYDPDRFGPPREEHKQGNHVLIGFGGGRHRCLGMHFAYMQIKALWSVLMSRYDLDLISPSPAPDYGSWVTGPRPPCRVRYRRRPVPLGPNL